MQLPIQTLGKPVLAVRPTKRLIRIRCFVDNKEYQTEVAAWDISFPKLGFLFFAMQDGRKNWRVTEAHSGMRIGPHFSDTKEEAIAHALKLLEDKVRRSRIQGLRAAIDRQPAVDTFPADAPTETVLLGDDEPKRDIHSVKPIKF